MCAQKPMYSPAECGASSHELMANRRVRQLALTHAAKLVFHHRRASNNNNNNRCITHKCSVPAAH